MNTDEQEPTVARANGMRRVPEAEREKILTEWASSGRTVEEMAAATGWSRWTLYRWRAQARGEVPGSRRRAGERALVAVPAPVATASGEWAAELLTATGIRVRLAASCAPAWAGQLARELNRC